MLKRRSAVAVCLAAALLSSAGCKSSEEVAASSNDAAMAVKADNATCPFSGRAVNANMSPIAYKGKNVGFCCPNCAAKFTKMSDAEKDTTIASMK